MTVTISRPSSKIDNTLTAIHYCKTKKRYTFTSLSPPFPSGEKYLSQNFPPISQRKRVKIGIGTAVGTPFQKGLSPETEPTIFTSPLPKMVKEEKKDLGPIYTAI